MLENLLQSMVEVTLSMSVVIAVLLCLTPVLGRHYAAKWRYWVWMIVALRLVLPFNLSFPQAVVTVPVPQREIIFAVDVRQLPDIAPPQNPAQLGAGTATPAQVEQYNMQARQYEDTMQAARKQAGKSITLSELLGIIWLAGAAGLLLWQGVVYLHFSRKVRCWGIPPHNPQVELLFERIRDNLGITRRVRLMVCPKASTPMIMGVVAPVVLLPTEHMDGESLWFVLRHELVHLKRRDILYKQLLLLACAMHWFNPLVWLMVREANRDVEISCDDTVVKHMDGEQRGRYAEVIMTCVRRSRGMPPVFTTQFSGGKKALKKRLANLFDTRKKRSGIAALCAVLVVAVVASGLVACTAIPDADMPTPDTSSASDAVPSNSHKESPAPSTTQEDAESLYTDIMLKYGAVFTDYPESGLKLQPHRGASLYYSRDWDEQAPLEATDYFSWYMGYIWQEDLTDEQRAEKYKSPYGEGTGWFFPQAYYEPNVQQYFDVSTELLRSSGAYLPQEEGYLQGGGGLGDLPELLLYKAVAEGDRLDLHITLRYGDYEYAGRPNEYKLLSVSMRSDGSYRYIGYVTDNNPEPAQAEAARRDNTAISTNTGNVYVNDALGLTLDLPQSWTNNYIATAQESGYAQVDGTGWSIMLSYKDVNNGAVLGYVFAVPVELWEEVRVTSTSFDVVLGRNSRYVFTGDMWKNPFGQGEDYELFNQMSFPVQDMVAMATATEPK